MEHANATQAPSNFAIHQPILVETIYADHTYDARQLNGTLTVIERALTLGQRALGPLGIALIAAYSPEARGRSERLLRTLQDRLPKELALAGIITMVAANRFFEARLRAGPQPPLARRSGPSPVRRSCLHWGSLADILCVQETRVVTNDNTVRYDKRVLQIPPDRHRCLPLR